MTFYICFILFNIVMCGYTKHISTKSTLSLVTPCSVGMKFATEVNNTSGEDYIVELNPNVCCLGSNDENCDIVILTGGDIEEIPKGTTRTLYLVAPLLDPYDRRGHCTAYLDYRPGSTRNIKRETIKIHFDTTIKQSNSDNLKRCKNLDEDPLNDCKPVDCEVYYNGRRTYYNNKLKRCVQVPACVNDLDNEVPNVIYDPISNKCIDGKSVTTADMDFIKSLNGNHRETKNIMIIENTLPKAFIAVNNTGQHIKTSNRDVVVTKLSTFSFMKCLKSNSYTLTILIIVILIQCCLICTMIYCMTKSCGCGRKKTVIRKFFNYRQDVSVTTPLIGTSNMDTETTDYQYLSESSNIDNKIKCYKACQKERKNNAKLSMSDDILTKCLNRRDWNRVPKSETIAEANNEDDNKINAKQTKVTEYPENKAKIDAGNPEPKINVNVDKSENKSTVTSAVKSNVDNGFVNVVSEKEILCHDYNVTDRTMFRCKKFNAPDTEKGAQAYFSNESIDDFLSERGLIFLGENASKYSFTSVSTDAKSTSSRTSKNNIVKNVISLFSRKSKSRLSDPGLNKSKANLNLELIHMSHASVCSSSNDEYVKSLKRLKDSRSSL